MTTPVLQPDRPDEEDFPCPDYTLTAEHTIVWITVGNISVHISRHEEAVTVNLFAKGAEDEEALDSAVAFYDDAQEVIKQKGSEDTRP